MPDDAHYALEKFNDAIRLLAIGAGDIRERLALAGPEILRVRAERVPEEFRPDYLGIVSALTKHEPRAGFDGRLRATLHRMRRATGVHVAESILVFRYRLCSHLEP